MGRTGIHGGAGNLTRKVSIRTLTMSSKHLSFQYAQRTVSEGCFLEQASTCSPKRNAVKFSGGPSPGGDEEVTETGNNPLEPRCTALRRSALIQRQISVDESTTNTLLHLCVVFTEHTARRRGLSCLVPTAGPGAAHSSSSTFV